MNKFMDTLEFQQKKENNQLDSLVLLRGVAVIMVCFCHFGAALSNGHVFSDLFQIFDEYGKYGVHVFFVISGFIIPFSLLKGSYDINDYFRFLYKRFLRLHPPYIAALVFTLVIMYLSYKVRHLPFPEDIFSILKSLVYFHIPADNPVFWTLIVEAEYYLFIGLFYILLMKYTKVAYFVAIPVLLILSSSIVDQYFALQAYLVFFFIGNVGYMIYSKSGSAIINIAVLLLILIYTACFYEMAAFVASSSTAAFILLYRKPVPTMLKFAGGISYSVYLIHFPLGIKLINFVKPKIDVSCSWLLFVVTLTVTLIASWLFYKLFEEFSERLSKKIKYNAASKKQIVIASSENN